MKTYSYITFTIIANLLREAFKKKEFQLGNCPKRWEGVNLKTLFFIVENKEIQVRREGSEPNFLIFVPILSGVLSKPSLNLLYK